MFGSYQLSEMAIQKWHYLDHLSMQIREIDGTQYMHGGFYECSYKVFKAEYENKSKQKKNCRGQNDQAPQHAK